MRIERNVRFLVDKELDKIKSTEGNKAYKIDGKLRLRIKYKKDENTNDNIVAFNVGYRVEIEKWIANVQRCKSGTTHGKKKVSATEINNEIQRLEEIAENIFKVFEVKEAIPTPDEFRDAFNTACGKQSAMKVKDSLSFFDYFDEFVNESGSQNDWKEGTYEKFAAVRNHLIGFDEKLTFEALNDTKLTDYIKYLRTMKGHRNKTIEKQLGYLKWFLRWAMGKGYNNNNAFQTFSPKLKNTDKKVIFLTWEELMHLNDFEVPSEKQYLARVRDIFCFCCFTSLRYSDVYNLKRSDIKDNHIEVTTVKTADSLIIELNKYSKAILDKYKNVHFENNKALPVISNQKMNDYLKELGKLAGIDEPIRETYYRGNERIDEVKPKYALLGTHAGRRTFICAALSMGIPAQTVMKWTGHADYKAMKPYIDVADKDRQEAMKVWDIREKEEDANKTSDLLEQLESLPKEQLIALLSQINK